MRNTDPVSTRKIAIEEELLLTDPETGRLVAGSSRAVQARTAETKDGVHDIEQELFEPQLETATQPFTVLGDLLDDVCRCRVVAAQGAEHAGAVLAAVAAPVLDEETLAPTRNARYQRIVDGFGLTSRQAVVCGMHVHVDIDGDEEGVAVLDRLRPWLPVLLALSANSPFGWGHDSGHASWRSQVWNRWPTAGPSEPFGDVAGYRAASDALIGSGAAFDAGMLYFDARLAASFPTVEVRVADVCTEVDDAVLIAALCRGLVETAAAQWRAGEPVPVWRSDLLRAAHWRAGRFGLSGLLLDPVGQDLAPARQVVDALLAHVAAALTDAGDAEWVRAAYERLVARGSGASRQRAVAEANGWGRGGGSDPENGAALLAVVIDLQQRTRVSP